MLVVMINTEGYFAVGKVVGGSYDEIQEWTYTSALLKGYGNQNKVSISYNDGGGEYTMKINERQDFEYKFKDIKEPVSTGGKRGYVVVISPKERFPEKPCEVDFMEE
jgi:hypothetical protein